MRVLTPEPEKLYTWWSYRATDNWRAADQGRRLDHIWTSDALADRVSAIKIGKNYRGSEATVGSRAGDGDDRALKLLLKLSQVLSRASSARFTPASSRDQDCSRSIMLSRSFSAASG